MNALFTEKQRSILFGMPLSFTSYTLYSDKLMRKEGFFSIKTKEMTLFPIVNAVFVQSRLQKRLGIGDIHIASTDPHQPGWVIRNIRHGQDFLDALQLSVKKEQERLQYHADDYIAS